MMEKQPSESEKERFLQRLHEKMSGECWVSLRGVEGELTFELNLDGQAVGLKPDTFLSRRVRCNPLPQVFELQKNTSGRYILHPLPPIVSPGDISLAAAGSRTLVFLPENSGTQNKPSEKPVNPRTVSAGIENTRTSIQSATMTGAPPDALQKKYADLIAQIRKENFQGVFSLKSISPEQAQIIVYAANTSPTGPLGVGLSIESMTPDVAKELIKTRSYSLYLPALRTLNLETAKILAMRDGSLYLDGLEVMTPSLAAVFATHKHKLSLRGLKNINLPLATELAKHRGSLSLNSVQMVTPEIVKILASGGQRVSLQGLQQMTPDTVSTLADASNIDLYHSNIGLNSSSAYLVRRIRQGEFNEVKWAQSFSPQVATELVNAYPEQSLSLEVKQLLPATAKALAAYTGDLHFKKIERIGFTYS